MIKSFTVNKLLSMQKIIRERLNDLKTLREGLTKKETTWMTTTENKTVEPTYDIKLVDKKITELQNFLYTSDASIKESNATVKVELEADIDSLLSPLE